MEFGIQLPTSTREPNPLKYVTEFVREADQMGYKYLSYVDHFGGTNAGQSGRGGLLDPPTLSAAVAEASGRMKIVPAISLIVNRGIVPMVKHYATMDVLTGGRMIVGLGPGSQDREYEMVGLDPAERWARFEEAVRAVKSLLIPGAKDFKGKYYSTEGFRFEPYSVQEPHIPIWLGAWGSDVSLRRVARHADGWLGSALDSTPERFGEAKRRLDPMLAERGKDPASFPNAVCTMAMFISEDPAEYEGMGRPPERALREGEPPRQRVMVGPQGECIEKLHRWNENGAKALFLNPTRDGIRQAYNFMNNVASTLPQGAAV